MNLAHMVKKLMRPGDSNISVVRPTVADNPVLIDSSPEIMALATNRHEYLIEKPRVTGARLVASNFPDKLLTEFETPLPHSFMVTTMPRAASNSSISRKLRAK